jgi:hypothetical protein
LGLRFGLDCHTFRLRLVVKKGGFVMAGGSAEPLGEKERLQVLLAEYNTLRAEILTRTSNGFQVASISAGLIAILLQWPVGVRFWMGLSLGLTLCGCCLWIILSATAKLEARLRTLEQAINDRVGEELLTWERSYGAAQKGPYGALVRYAKRLGVAFGIARYPE